MTTESPIVDRSRESWVLLILGSYTLVGERERDPAVTYWELAIGNADELVETNTERLHTQRTPSQTVLIRLLYRRLCTITYHSPLLIGLTDDTFPILRKQLRSHICGAPVRGFNFLSFQSILADYFNQRLSDVGLAEETWTLPHVAESESSEIVSGGTIEDFWETWLQYFKLIPVEELRGSPV